MDNQSGHLTRTACLVIVGMHRSGTSVLTGTLGLLGASLPTDPLGSNRSNPKGHFESRALIALNERLLSQLDSCWYDIKDLNFDTANSAFIDKARRNISKVIRTRYDYDNIPKLLVLKDPRLCRLLPLTLSAIADLPASPYLVVCVRNPLEVARSLEKRNKIAQNHGLSLWLRYMLDGEFYSRDYPRVFVNYSEFLQDWQSIVEKIEKRLGILFPSKSNSALKTVDKFVDTKLRHNVAGFQEPIQDTDMGVWITKCYRALSSLTHDPDDKNAMNVLDSTRSSFDVSTKIFGPVISDYYKSNDYAEKKDREIEKLKIEIDFIRTSSSWRLLESLRKIKYIVTR